MAETADWLQRLQARADAPPAAPRAELWVQGGAAPIGSLESGLAQRLVAAGLPLRAGGRHWQIDASTGPALDGALERIARWLAAQGSITRWRDELLSVRDVTGRPVARMERAAVRALGIATDAVHLVGRAPNGDTWVQQRAFDKAVDPGLWDTLMGGLVSGAEDIAGTLARETWEEAGLRLADLTDVAPRGRFTVRRPVADGYMVEHIHVFEGGVPEGLLPSNQDGEVVRFARLALPALQKSVMAGDFTLEAALILAGPSATFGPG
jgi:8-oxo-dGTP pyrophosphatase MutT (NUDIX family)